MNTGVISKRYAKALYQFAEETKKQEVVYRAMTVLAESFLQVPELRKALDNPLLSAEQKLTLLCSAAGGVNVCPELKRFMTLVLDRHRESVMQFIACSYIDLYRKKKDILIGKLTTAIPVDKRIEDRMRAIIMRGTKGTVEFETVVEPSIEGGFILDIDFNRLDASIATQLNRVRRQFMEKNRRIV